MKRTTRQQAYDIWKSIESDFENSNYNKLHKSTSNQQKRLHFKKLGDECVSSGRQPIISVLGGKTVTPKKLETIRRTAKERRTFTDDQIIEMKELYTNDITIDFRYLAEKYGCSIGNIHLIMHGEIYSDVGEPVKIRPALFKCPHCDKSPMIKSNLSRFHGDNCKQK